MSKKIFYATTNQGKVHSLGSTLAPFGFLVSQLNIDLVEGRTYDIKEIALSKVSQAAKLSIARPIVTLDSGFFIESLNGFPMTFVNFVLETIGVEGILKLVAGQSRVCEFRNCLAYYDDNLSEPKIFESETRGCLADGVRGDLPRYAWSKLFQIFIPEGYDKTLAEMTEAEYNSWRESRSQYSYANKLANWLTSGGE